MRARRSEDPIGNEEARAAMELRILVESFYHSAWRLIVLLDHNDEPVVGIQGLRRRCPGIREVRNQLLEHPEGADSRVFEQTFSFGDPEGPKIKSFRLGPTEIDPRTEEPTSLFAASLPDHTAVDRGLYVNAAELVGALAALIPSSSGPVLHSPPRRPA